MIARPTNWGRWKVMDGGDLIIIWLEVDGLHSKRFSKTSSGAVFQHAEIILKFDDIILKAEGQMKLL